MPTSGPAFSPVKSHSQLTPPTRPDIVGRHCRHYTLGT